jgi:hypothetical protein
VSDFPLQGFTTLGPYPERPTLLMVWEGRITQDIAAVLIKCQQNSAVLGGIVVVGQRGRWSFVAGRWLKPVRIADT